MSDTWVRGELIFSDFPYLIQEENVAAQWLVSI